MSVFLKVFAICVLFTLAECKSTSQLFIPCRRGDAVCFKVSLQLLLQELVPGIPSLGIKPSDPIRHKEISGTFRKFDYNFTDVTSTGLRNCIINSVKFNFETNIAVELLCLNLTFSGKYDVQGEIVGKKIKDASKFVTRTTTYLLGIIAKVDHVRGVDGKKHLKLINIETHSTALGRVKVTMENSDELEKFVDSIWRVNVKLVDQSFIDASLKYLVARANEFLKKVPVDNLFIKDSARSCWKNSCGE